MELQTTRELLASSLKKVQDLELESGKVPALQSRIHELERNLGKSNNNTRYVHTLCSVNDVREGITQESPMGDSWVIPRKVDKMV